MLIHRKVGLALTLALALAFSGSTAVVTSGCGGRLAAPGQLTAAGDVAFYADRAIHAVEAIQSIAIDGEAAGVVSREDATTIVTATKVAGIAGVDLAKALRAGLSEVTARDKAIATMKEALTNLPARLSPETAKLVSPYIQAVLMFLTVYS